MVIFILTDSEPRVDGRRGMPVCRDRESSVSLGGLSDRDQWYFCRLGRPQSGKCRWGPLTDGRTSYRGPAPSDT